MHCSCEKATGGGAFKFADLFRKRLGVSIEKEDEMDCLVAGANFLLKVNLFHFPFQLDFILVHYFAFPETGNWSFKFIFQQHRSYHVDMLEHVNRPMSLNMLWSAFSVFCSIFSPPIFSISNINYSKIFWVELCYCLVIHPVLVIAKLCIFQLQLCQHGRTLVHWH